MVGIAVFARGLTTADLVEPQAAIAKIIGKTANAFIPNLLVRNT